MTDQRRVEVPRAALAVRAADESVADVLRRLLDVLQRRPDLAIRLVEAAELLAGQQGTTALSLPRAAACPMPGTCGACGWFDEAAGECCVDPPIASHTGLGYTAARPKVTPTTRACSRCESKGRRT